MTNAGVLLDQTDRRRRLLQHGAILGGILLLAPVAALIDVPGHWSFAIATMAAGLLLLAIATTIKQRWTVDYKGHVIKFENNPIRGERLFIDGELAGKGKIGYRSEIRGVLRGGDGSGEAIVASTTAGLLSFHCRIVAERVEPPAAARSASLTDTELLDEVRRRGL